MNADICWRRRPLLQQGVALYRGEAQETAGLRAQFSEITSKIHEYFSVGVRQVWIVIPVSEETYVYDSPQSPRVIRWTDELSGEPVLPGFRVKLMDLIQEEFPE